MNGSNPGHTELAQSFGKYEILRYLGGGMSRVYEARDTVLNRGVALKVLAQDVALDGEARARFLREAQIASGVDSDHVVKIYDFGEIDGQLFLVSELLRGADLRQALQEGTLGTFPQRLRILVQLADGLSAIHERGIIHRDIKPENIHIDRNGRVRLMDFGVARSETLNLTRTGITMGTPYYMAPEQVQAARVDSRTDLYSLGIVAYEMFIGHRPITGDNVAALFYKILNEPLDLQQLEAANLPKPLIAVIASCTAKRIEDRPKSAEDVGNNLRTLLGEGDSVAVVIPVQREKRWAVSSAPWVIALVIAAVTLLAIILLSHPWRDSVPTATKRMQPKASETATQNQTLMDARPRNRGLSSGGDKTKTLRNSTRKDQPANPFEDHSHPPAAGPFTDH